MNSNPIGVFDSGLGGLTVVKAMKKLLPKEDILYLGDMARLPYGTKSKNQIVEFSLANADFLVKKNVKAIVIACNSSSANAYSLLKRQLSIPVIDVIIPAAGEAAKITSSNEIGILGTSATIASEAYSKELKRINSNVKVFSKSCPLFVPLVEEGWLNNEVTEMAVDRYLSPFKEKGIDTLILGCTHYPLLRRAISEYLPGVRIVESGPSTAAVLRSCLQSNNILSGRRRDGVLKVFLTDYSPNFVNVGRRFLKDALSHLKVVHI